MSPKKTIKVDYLARVEGEGSLYIDYDESEVRDVKLKIFEPPRFFEGFLRGRDYSEAPDITARICGICPVAYQMSAVHAMEQILGIRVSPEIRELRRLFYCGEWIESHVLHITMLHAPDFLGFADAIEMAQKHKKAVERGLRLKRRGNSIVALLGGREVHPINVRVGGFYRIPERHEFQKLKEELLLGREEAQELVKWVSGFEFPEYERDYTFVSLVHPGEYPFNEGEIGSSNGLRIPASQYDESFVEEHVEYSNALHSQFAAGGSYFCGPMARYALNFEQLSPMAQEAAKEAGLAQICRNPFQSIIVRAVEVLYAFDEAIRVIDGFQGCEPAWIEGTVREGTGFGATEAPRGLLYHRFRINGKGKIEDAKIVAPTSQNQKTIEEDLREYVKRHGRKNEKQLTWECEQAIRNYDPCISCATHFLKIKHFDSGRNSGQTTK